MENELEFIDAILSGDDSHLSQLLHDAHDQESILRGRISVRPTNHAIGYGMTLLQLASFRPRGTGKSANVLLEHGAELDIHSACGLGETDRVAEILKLNSDAFDQEVDTYFPIQFAISASHAAVIQCLCDHGDDPNRPLRKVAYFGWEDDIINDDYTRWRPIHMAALWGFDANRIPVMEMLLSAGADLRAVSPLDGFQPLHLVAMPNRVEMIRFLVSRRAEVDGRTSLCKGMELNEEEQGPVSGFENTPLMVAAAEGFVEASACLIELGADPTAKNSDSMTALEFARKEFWPGQPYDQVVALLNQRSTVGNRAMFRFNYIAGVGEGYCSTLPLLSGPWSLRCCSQ